MEATMSRYLLVSIRCAVLAALPAVAAPVLWAQPVQNEGRAQEQPGSSPRPESSRAPDGSSTTRGQTDSNPDRPSASPGERAPTPNGADNRQPGQGGASAPGPMPRGQGTVEPHRPDAPAGSTVPGGRAGSGGHKHGGGR